MSAADDYAHSIGDAEQRALEWAKKLELVESLAGVGHWRYDLKSRRVSWSPEVFRIHGVTPDTFDPNLDDAVAAYHPDDRPILLNYIARAETHGEAYAFKLRIHRLSDGELRIVTAKASVQCDDAGVPICMFGVFQDVTEIEQTMARLAESEARYRMLADHSTDIIVRAGRDGIIRYASPAVRILGLKPEDAIGRSSLDFVAPEHRAFSAQIIDDLFSGEEPDRTLRRDHKVTLPDGASLWLEGNPNIVRDEAGNPVEFITAFRNVTARRQLEDELAEARRIAEAAGRAKAEFLANVSHELRTPLTSLLGFSRLLEQHAMLDDDARRYVNRIATAGQTLLTSINDILDFSRLEAGRLRMKPVPTMLETFFVDALDLFEPAANAKGISLGLVCRERLPPCVLVDQERLRQVLVNLLGNAVKFTRRGAVTLEVGYVAPAGMIFCIVSDTGPGIPADMRGRLFDRFAQGDDAQDPAGTGLGLAISMGMVTAMGGELLHDETYSNGARFRLTVPAPRTASPTVAVDAPATLGSLTHTRVLFASPDNLARAHARTLLGPVVYALTEAGHADGAVTLLREQLFDVVIVDLSMPEADCARILRAAKGADGPNDAAFLLAVAVPGSLESPQGLRAKGFDDTLSAPLSLAALATSIAALSDDTPETGRNALHG